MPRKFQHRREFLTGAAGIGIAGVAGCLGDENGNGVVDDDGHVDMRVGSSTEGSTVYQTSQAIQRVLDEQSDILDWDTQTTGGDPGSVRLYDDGELEAYGLENRITRLGMDGEEPFENEKEIPYQGFSYFVRDDHFMAVDGSGIETTDDMLGADVHLLQPGWGTRDLFMTVMEEEAPDLHEELTENVVNIDMADLAGAIEEGQVEAFIAYANNGVNLPGWLEEVDARADIHHVEITEEWQEVFEASDLVDYYEREPYGYDQDIGTDTMQGWNLLFQYYISPEVPAEHVYELLEICHEHYESVQEGQPAFFDYGEEPERFTAALQDHRPVHPGAADFYEEHDLWEDEWERGEEPE